MTLDLTFVSETDWPIIAGKFADLTFEQTLTYSRAAAARIGAQARYAVLGEAVHPVAAVAIRIKTVPGLGRGIAWVPSGPLLRPAGAPLPTAARIADILSALRVELGDRQGHILRLRPAAMAAEDAEVFAEGAAQAGLVPSARAPAYDSIALDLAQDEASLMAALNGKWRTDLRYALKSDLTLEIGESTDLQNRFLSLFQAVQGAKGFQPDITPEFHFRLPAGDYPRKVLIAVKDGIDLAGIVIGAAGRTVTYLFGATGPEGRRLKAGYFLTWEGTRWAREEGFDWYDLGGVDAEANPDVARFKMRMNGMPIHASPYETRPGGAADCLIRSLEALRTRLRLR